MATLLSRQANAFERKEKRGTMRRFVRDAARLLPPLRRLHDFALEAEASRRQSLAVTDELHAKLATYQSQLEARDADLAAARAEMQARDADLAAARAETQARDADLATARTELDARNADLAVVRAELQETAGRVDARSPEERQRHAHWAYLKNRRQLVELDFPVTPKVRHGYGAPSEPLMRARLEANTERFADQMRGMLPLLEPMLTIPRDPVEDGGEPNWVNPAFPALDAMALYGMIATRRPKRLIEIGSGFSTKFARRAIRDHGLSTQIISIDPEPRAEVDAICDEVVRKPLEDVPMSFFEDVTVDDLVFYDGSHRAFQNSDVTVFFTEILPRLRPGTMFGIHDIFLPDDYPPAWLEWYFSEQYLLACWLLAGDRLQVQFPAYFIGETPALHGIFASMWQHPALQGANHKGGAFFATVT